MKETYNIAVNKEVLMNVAFFLRPKFQVVYMYENDSTGFRHFHNPTK